MIKLEFLKYFAREIVRYARWLYRHRADVAEIAAIIARLVRNAEIEGGTGNSKRARVLMRAARCRATANAPRRAVALAVENAVCEMEDARADGRANAACENGGEEE